MIKPDLHNAKVSERTSYKRLIDAGVPPVLASQIIERQGKELNSGDMDINATFKILGDCVSTSYPSVSTSGTGDHISMFRLCGGCNHLEAFWNGPSTEKSRDYDELDDSDICMFSEDFETDKSEILRDYIGKTLRVVARTGMGTASFDTRYYLFTLD